VAISFFIIYTLLKNIYVYKIKYTFWKWQINVNEVQLKGTTKWCLGTYIGSAQLWKVSFKSLSPVTLESANNVKLKGTKWCLGTYPGTAQHWVGIFCICRSGNTEVRNDSHGALPLGRPSLLPRQTMRNALWLLLTNKQARVHLISMDSSEKW